MISGAGLIYHSVSRLPPPYLLYTYKEYDKKISKKRQTRKIPTIVMM